MPTSNPLGRMHLAASAEAQVEGAGRERTMHGLAVPYGVVGHSSVGAVRFAQGSIQLPADVGRVKLLVQHDTNRPIGYATELTDRTDGLAARFAVGTSAEADQALANLEDGTRDAFSVGVALDQPTIDALIERWIEGSDEPVDASGELLEVSHVTIPAFADARVEGSPALLAASSPDDAGRVLVVTFEAPQTTQALAATKEGTPPMPVNATARAAANDSAEVDQVDQVDEVDEVEAAAPRPNATAGAAGTTDRPVYTFDGSGPSFVRDAYLSRFDPYSNPESVSRFTRFTKALEAGDAGQLRQLTAAVETRTTAPETIEQGYRPDMLVQVIDKGRPLTSRIGTVNLTDATPYRLPVEGEFTGVADHVEGTAHAPEGDLSMDDALIEPGAVSGAYRLSRELVDSSNPALDRIAINAMSRDYRRVTEAKVNTALEADGGAAVTVANVEDVSEAIDAYFDVLTDQPDFIAAGGQFYSVLRADKDTTGRPMLARVGPANANGTITAGGTGAEIDGVDLVRAYSVDSNNGWLIDTESVHIGEGALRMFRFEEVEGPGVIKLALWNYFVAKVIRAAGVKRLASA